MDRWSGREAKLLRHALRMSVRGFAEYLGLPVRTITRWESLGEARTPRPQQQQILDTALSRATEEERARFDAALAATRRSGANVVEDVRLTNVAEVRDDVRDLVIAYDSTPSVALLAPATRIQAAVASLRTQASNGLVRRELVAAEAEVAIFMAQLIWDASQRRDHDTAGSHLAHAIALAREVGEVVTEAHAVLRQSFIALYGRAQPRDGLTLARRAADLSRNQSPALTGLALLHVAEAHAMLGDRQACETSLALAESSFDRRTDVDIASDHYSPPQVSRLTGSCYLSLGLPQTAEAFLNDAAAALASQEKVSALVLGNLGIAHIRQRNLDAALAVLHTAIDGLEQTRGGAGLNVVFSAARELQPWRTDPAVHEVQDRLLGLLATA